MWTVAKIFYLFFSSGPLPPLQWESNKPRKAVAVFLCCSSETVPNSAAHQSNPRKALHIGNVSMTDLNEFSWWTGSQGMCWIHKHRARAWDRCKKLCQKWSFAFPWQVWVPRENTRPKSSYASSAQHGGNPSNQKTQHPADSIFFCSLCLRS